MFRLEFETLDSLDWKSTESCAGLRSRIRKIVEVFAELPFRNYSMSIEADGDEEYVRPQVSISYLKDLLISEYKLKIIDYAELNSHEDRNFHIFCEKTESTEHKSEFSQDKCESVCTGNSCSAIQTDLPVVCSKCEYVVKVMDEHVVHSEDFSRSERIQMQMKVQEHLLNCGFICPKVIRSSSGSVVQSFIAKEENVYYLMYMTKYIHGPTLLDIAPLSTEMLYDVGSLLAQLHCSLKDAAIPSLELKSASVWALENAFKIKDFVTKAELDDGEQSLVLTVLDHFAQNVLAQVTELPHGVIHGDFHDENILILERNENNHATENPDQVVRIRSKYAVIDFGDISYSPLVFDLAISASYFMMSHTGPDFIEAIGHFLCGYFMTRQPTQKEVRSLFASICAAFCREVVLAKHSYLEQSRSNSYLITAVDAGLRQLKDIWRIGQGNVMTVWYEIWERYGLTLL